MKDEIKEIYLSNLEWTKTHDNMGGVMGNLIFKDNFAFEDFQKLFKPNYFILCDKDYITNLQEELDRCVKANVILDDENAELQGENQKLKELCDKYEEEHSTEFKIWKDERHQLLDYKSRNEKAIEYINTHYLNANESELLNILNGGVEE